MYLNVVVGINGLSGDPDAVALAKALAPRHDHFALASLYHAHVRVIEGWSRASTWYVAPDTSEPSSASCSEAQATISHTIQRAHCW
jgi:hypothetical protein